MNKRLDTFAHSSLYLALAVGGVAVIASRNEPTRQFVVLTMLVFFYLVWGFAYHHYKKDLHSRLVWEYLLIAGIAVGAGYLVLMS